MPQLLQFSLTNLKEGTISPRWLTHMLILNKPRIMNVLKKVGMTFVGEFEDQEDGKVWRWECT